MASQRTIAIAGLRTAPRPAWRHEIGSALVIVAGQPYLWLIGALGFCLRGGIVLLAVPIIVLPTQVEVRLALGANLGSTGLTTGFWALLGSATIISTIVALAALYALAHIEWSAHERTVADSEFDELAELGPSSTAPPVQERQQGLLGRLFVVQSLALVALLLSAVPLAAAVGQATLDEILRPSSSVSIYLRVLGHVLPELALLVVALGLIDMFSALATRELMVGNTVVALDRRPRRASLLRAVAGAARRVVRAPLRTLATAVVAWLATIAVILPLGWALTVAWQTARASFLSTTSVADLFAEAGPFIVALMLSAVFVAGLAMAGFASAFRAATWTIEVGRR